MMLKYSFSLEEESKLIEAAVKSVLKSGYRTEDIYSDGMQKVSTSQMGDLIAAAVLKG